MAERLWYPLWDSGVDIDHAVRSLSQSRQVAASDLPAVIGWLSVRAVAGDAVVVHRAASAVLTDWRAAARRRLPELISSTRDRAQRAGELAYLIEPDLKEARGGMRDAVLLSALAATWLTDRPHGAVDAVLHAPARRARHPAGGHAAAHQPPAAGRPRRGRRAHRVRRRRRAAGEPRRVGPGHLLRARHDGARRTAGPVAPGGRRQAAVGARTAHAAAPPLRGRRPGGARRRARARRRDPARDGSAAAPAGRRDRREDRARAVAGDDPEPRAVPAPARAVAAGRAREPARAARSRAGADPGVGGARPRRGGHLLDPGVGGRAQPAAARGDPPAHGGPAPRRDGGRGGEAAPPPAGAGVRHRVAPWDDVAATCCCSPRCCTTSARCAARPTTRSRAPGWFRAS